MTRTVALATTPDRADQRRRTRFQTGMAVAVLLVCVSLIAGMALFILREIEDLSSANSDNVQWSLSQADVEFIRFQLALSQAQVDGDAEHLNLLRRRYDIFYSRMTTLRTGTVYADVRQDFEFTRHLLAVDSFLNDVMPVIDAPDSELLAGLPLLTRKAQMVFPDVRSMSLAGLAAFAERSDERRTGLISMLVLLAVVLAVIFSGLVLFAYFLFRLYRLAETRADLVVEASEHTRMIVSAAPDAIIVTDANGRILDFNPEAQRTFGHSRSAALGEDALTFLFADQAADDLRRELASDDDAPTRHFETRARDKAGKIFPAEVSVAREGGGAQLILFVGDISRRKEAEEGLTVARDRALAGERAKAEFLAVMSHEMRTPLNGMLGTMQLMRDHKLDERQTDLLDRMERSGRQLHGLVDDVLDLSKFEAGKMTASRKPFSIGRVLDGVVETAAPLASAGQNDLGWSWQGPEKDDAIGDARRLRQVLLNLVGNAIKFTRGGSVDIEVECLRDGKTLEIRVIDTGIGISSDDMTRIFNDFETLDSSYARQAGGTGLGLGIAQRLIRLMGGEIGAESEAGEGSIFWVRMPLCAGGVEAEAVPAAEVEDRTPSRSLDLLLVEDNETNRFVARQMLEAEGHRVTEAVNGRAGLEWAEDRAFDVILMDVSMPVMDGPEATRRIRAGGGPSSDRPIIAVTAHALPEEIEGFEAAGMNACISKPLSRAKLMTTLAEIVDGAGAGQSGGAAPSRADLIDTEQLDVLRAGLPEDRRDDILQRFIDETDQTIARLSTDTPEAEGLVARVHACAGNCGTFGAVALRAALAGIETNSKRGTPITRDQLTALAPLWQDTRAALLDHIQ
ncbi:hybrid sensor histidine kinase/response regulator [Pseudooceanicola nitratireducens]|uniref:hybrid sensor histidine kinase/response regulator n=1 Tax=Pseudooceanicola nitratireducens TaxID=517719 RepID=UPI001C94A69B|nr:ATP-binding protein [Pseudooceanicola nitratireducens]MBY6155859.1 response regulator [Pseudooceanicola nitratireducens]